MGSEKCEHRSLRCREHYPLGLTREVYYIIHLVQSGARKVADAIRASEL